MFSVWFECKTCRGSFLELSHFLEHKKQDHFDEFRNTECIIFEERRIPNNEQTTVSISSTPQEIGKTNPHEFIDPQTIKIDNFDDRTSAEFQSHTDQTLNFFEANYTISSDQDFENDTDDFISSNNGASATHSVNASSILENSTVTNAACLDTDSHENSKTILDLENNADAAINVNPDAFNSSDLKPTQLFIETQRNPFVLLKRLTCQEIQRCSGTGLKRTRSGKYTGKADSFVHSEEKCSDKKLNNLFECKLCLDKFNTDLELTVHTNSCILSHPNRKRFCVPCKKIFSTSDSLRNHVFRNHPDKQKSVKSKKLKKCHLCNYSALTKYKLSRHEQTHASIKRFKCPQCEYRASTNYSIKLHVTTRHTDTHTDNRLRLKQFSCRVCFEKFRTRTDLTSHSLKENHDNSFVCEFCGKTYRSKKGLGRHQKICHFNPQHSDPKWVKDRKKFKCSVCQFSTISKNHLAIHSRTHSGERPFKCPFCTFAASTNGILHTHIRTHTRERPFKCSHCDYRAARQSRLRDHIARLHSSADIAILKRFKCHLCSKSFFTNQSLIEHTSVHTMERPYACNKCDYTCSWGGNLKRHIKTHADRVTRDRRRSMLMEIK